MRRILFFETSLFTGATRVTRTIAKKISKRFDVRSAVISTIDDPALEIQRAIEKEQPEILFCSFTTINPEVISVGKGRNLTVIVRNDYKFKDLSIEAQRKILQSYPKADWIIVQTSDMKLELQSLEPLRSCRIKVLDNPLDEEDILYKAAAPNPFEDNGNFHFLWVGRKDPIKDLPTLQKAFAIVHTHCPNTDLTLISDDPNPYRWMKHADCLVISSRSEASPNVLREALFLGTKVVATDCSQTVRRMLPTDRIVQVGKEIELAEVLEQLL